MPRAYRVLIVASAGLWLAALLALFVARAEVSHTYFHTIRSAPIALPWLTRAIALPVLGGAAAEGQGRAIFFPTWFILFGTPLAAAWWSLSGRDAAPHRWSLSLGVFVPFTLLVVLLVCFGLWLPHALLMGRM
jgi:hypothetical protein